MQFVSSPNLNYDVRLGRSFFSAKGRANARVAMRLLQVGNRITGRIVIRWIAILCMMFLCDTGCNYRSSTAGDVGDHQVRTIHSENFQTLVLQSEQPVLIHFWATHVGANLKVRKTLVALSNNYDGQITVGQINVSKNEALAQQYEITTTPAFLLVVDGLVVKKLEGLKSEAELRTAIDDVL